MICCSILLKHWTLFPYSSLSLWFSQKQANIKWTNKHGLSSAYQSRALFRINMNLNIWGSINSLLPPQRNVGSERCRCPAVSLCWYDGFMLIWDWMIVKNSRRSDNEVCDRPKKHYPTHPQLYLWRFFCVWEYNIGALLVYVFGACHKTLNSLYNRIRQQSFIRWFSWIFNNIIFKCNKLSLSSMTNNVPFEQWIQSLEEKVHAKYVQKVHRE